MRYNFKKWIMVIVAGIMLAASVPAFAQESAAGILPECGTRHLVQRGETLYSIARRYGVTVAHLTELNGLSDPNRILVGQSLCITEAAPIPTTYVVQRGDNLFRIARRFGVNMTVLARVNNLRDANRIYVGQTLVIPDVTIQS